MITVTYYNNIHAEFAQVEDSVSGRRLAVYFGPFFKWRVDRAAKKLLKWSKEDVTNEQLAKDCSKKWELLTKDGV